MMVEMERPFVWPDAPEKFDEWDKETFDAAREDRKEQQEEYDPKKARAAPSRERESIAKQAKALLRGDEAWMPTVTKYERDQWVDGEEEVEVETDQVIPKTVER